LYFAENGCKYRALPKRFGNLDTNYTHMNRLAKACYLTWGTHLVVARKADVSQAITVVVRPVQYVGLASSSAKAVPARSCAAFCSWNVRTTPCNVYAPALFTTRG